MDTDGKLTRHIGKVLATAAYGYGISLIPEDIEMIMHNIQDTINYRRHIDEQTKAQANPIDNAQAGNSAERA